MSATPTIPPPKRVNLRTPEVMEQVQAQVENHYRSQLVEQIRANGGTLQLGQTTVRLAKQFGFCYGVERAIDLAYAAQKVFPEKRLFILGEIIHNPEVNQQIAAIGVKNILAKDSPVGLDDLTAEDVVIVPAFGSEVETINRIRARGAQIVDTTCGDVMSVYKRVKQNAAEQVTSVIHGKASHEETRATASRARGNGGGHYLIVLNLAETDEVCHYLSHGGDREHFLKRFAGAYSPGFDPDIHLQRVGVANQTTMLRSETDQVQQRLRKAILERDGGDSSNFRFFDTICGATQERQDALFRLLDEKLNLLLVVGGYNSSNTTHLVEIGSHYVPTYFVRSAECLRTADEILHYDLRLKTEIPSRDWLPLDRPLRVGVTAGASCPNNLIAEVIERMLALRGEKF
ncbi:MAG TPA: 4-hydroxy-3-methylbut-2-enyl diphosphate reductase [Chthoniobacterales bacterium]